ncbi:hypothetical protein HOE425_330495 [Hoeflea sp. EC-HK425]|nr:hypothetical protein HOE425_330495 [Hoeflea sp. EC-HK425]
MLCGFACHLGRAVALRKSLVDLMPGKGRHGRIDLLTDRVGAGIITLDIAIPPVLGKAVGLDQRVDRVVADRQAGIDHVLEAVIANHLQQIIEQVVNQDVIVDALDKFEDFRILHTHLNTRIEKAFAPIESAHHLDKLTLKIKWCKYHCHATGHSSNV